MASVPNIVPRASTTPQQLTISSSLWVRRRAKRAFRTLFPASDLCTESMWFSSSSSRVFVFNELGSWVVFWWESLWHNWKKALPLSLHFSSISWCALAEHVQNPSCACLSQSVTTQMFFCDSWMTQKWAWLFGSGLLQLWTLQHGRPRVTPSVTTAWNDPN